MTLRSKGKRKFRQDWPTGPLRLRLYVAGSGARSIRAVQNVKRICEAEYSGHYDLAVIDIYKEPARAGQDQIVAIPTLIKEAPGLFRRIVGDLSETALVRRSLAV
jgi:circadian clock protein KaiB